jgi:general secretion pathway protein K
MEREPVMSTRPGFAQRGAVLLLALLAVALIASMIGSVLWRQSSLIRIESVERERQQALWLLRGAMDWGRLILREDARADTSDHLSEPWAVPLQDSRLSSFLATQPGSSEAMAGLEQDVILSGAIQDAQGRFNLSNLLQGKQVDPVALAQLTRLLSLLGLSPEFSTDLAQKMAQSLQPGGRWLPPRTVDDLAAWGWSEAQIERIRDHVTILPERTPVNINTASPEVLSASIEGLNLSAAERLVQSRARNPWTKPAQAQADLEGKWDAQRHDIKSNYFLLSGRLRLGQSQMAQTALVKRDGQAVVYRWVIAAPVSLAP